MVKVLSSYLEFCNERREVRIQNRVMTLTLSSDPMVVSYDALAKMRIEKQRFFGYRLKGSSASYVLEALRGATVTARDEDDARLDSAEWQLPPEFEGFRSSLEEWTDPSGLGLSAFASYLARST